LAVIHTAIVVKQSQPAELAVVIVALNSERWLAACLTSLFGHSGAVALDVVVVDNGSTDDTPGVVAEFPDVRFVQYENRGFAAANNRGVEQTSAPWVLFVNADTEIRKGTLSELLAACDRADDLGVAGVRQVWPDGTLQYTIRRFPSPLRSLGEALGSEAWPVHAAWLGERELDPERYGIEVECDWTSGSFMLVRRQALASAGLMDERFFLYCEEPDLCRRIKQAGWAVRHLPLVTVVHHGGNESSDPRLAAQRAYSRRLFMRKHFGRWGRVAGTAAMVLGYGLRAVAGGRDRSTTGLSRATSRAALATLLGLRGPPFVEPPRSAIAPRRRLPWDLARDAEDDAGT
jgi:N-acetylglucosaminyl-diphospho-decaprenol L-rhamnosyltransferase